MENIEGRKGKKREEKEREERGLPKGRLDVDLTLQQVLRLRFHQPLLRKHLNSADEA